MRTVGVAATALVMMIGSATPTSAGWSASTAPGGTAAVRAAALAAPSALGATLACPLLAARRVNLSWIATTTTFASGYDVLRSTTNGGAYSVAGVVSGRTTVTFTDQPPSSVGTTYYYVIVASHQQWRSGISNQAAVTMPLLC